MNAIAKYISILSIAAASVLTVSCSDAMLDEQLYSSLGTSNLPKNEKGAEQLVLGIYSYLYASDFQQLPIYGSDATSDQMFVNWGGVPEDGWAGQMNFLTFDQNHSVAQNAWQRAYIIIAQCNEVVRHFGALTSNTKIAEAVAEAKFWRAYCYYQLGLIYGNAPLVLEDTDMKNGVKQSPREKLYQFVIDELTPIDENNVLPHRRESSEWGRPTRWAVKTLLANLYLNKKDWPNALKYADDVMQHGEFTLMKEFQDVFDVEENSELILTIGCVGEYYRGNLYAAQSLEGDLIAGLGIQGVSGSNGLGMAVPFYNTYDPKDKRIQDFDPVTKKGIAIHGYLNNVETGEPIYKGSGGEPLKVEEALNRVVILKYPVQENAMNGEWMTQDVVVFRLAEVMLTYAEAQNELGRPDLAIPRINDIRRRAGVDELPLDLDQNEVRDAVLAERGWELFMEGYRRHDLIRHGKLLESIRPKWEYYLDSPFGISGEEFRNLYPIPAAAMILNPALKQNDGYNKL